MARLLPIVGRKIAGIQFHTAKFLFHLVYWFILLYAVHRRRQWHPTLVLLPGKSHGWRSLVGCSPWGCWGSDMTERLHFHFSLSCIWNGNPLQCSCLESPRDDGAWWAAIYGITQSRTWLKWLSSSSSRYRIYSLNHARFCCFLITHLIFLKNEEENVSH